MYFDPRGDPTEFSARIARWLDANGCRDWVALEPVILRGKVVEYQAACRKHKADREFDGKPGGIHYNAAHDDLVTTTKRMRVRIPLAKVA